MTNPFSHYPEVMAAIRIPVRDIIMGRSARKEKPNG